VCITYIIWTFQSLKKVSFQVEFLLVVTPLCSVVIRSQHFRGPCCLHLPGWCPATTLHSITTQKKSNLHCFEDLILNKVNFESNVLLLYVKECNKITWIVNNASFLVSKSCVPCVYLWYHLSIFPLFLSAFVSSFHPSFPVSVLSHDCGIDPILCCNGKHWWFVFGRSHVWFLPEKLPVLPEVYHGFH